jgi:hypothetical protein
VTLRVQLVNHDLLRFASAKGNFSASTKSSVGNCAHTSAKSFQSLGCSLLSAASSDTAGAACWKVPIGACDGQAITWRPPSARCQGPKAGGNRFVADSPWPRQGQRLAKARRPEAEETKYLSIISKGLNLTAMSGICFRRACTLLLGVVRFTASIGSAAQLPRTVIEYDKG